MSGLDTVLADVRACRICRDNPDGAALAHQPRPVLQMGEGARILIAGQAPGVRVHATGKPFCDPSGKRLRQWLNMDEETFYNPALVAILPMGFCFPGQDRRGGDLPPRPECARAWRSRLMPWLPRVELVLAIGQYAQRQHLGAMCKPRLTETVRHWRAPFESLKPATLPLPHPSWRNNRWLIDNPWFETELLPVLRARVARLL